MIDRHLLPLQHALTRPPARMLARRGIAADQVTIVGLGVGLLALPALWLGWFGLAAVLIVTNRVLDGLDGALARLGQPGPRGAFLDIAADFLFYALVPLGFALHDSASNALAASFLLFSFIGTGSSFLAFAAIAAREGRTATDYPAKGIYYLGGLTEGAETIAFFLAICLWPGQFASLAVIFGCLCLVTTLTRWHMAWTQFAERRPE